MLHSFMFYRSSSDTLWLTTEGHTQLLSDVLAPRY